MKLFFLAALTLSITAHAETNAARESRVAQMEAIYASGFYEPTRGATLALNYKESGEPLSLTLSVQGRKLTAWVWQAEAGRCGDRILARLNVPNENIVTDIRLTDYTNVRCRLWVKHKWHATVSTREASGSESRMELEGDPR